MDYEKAYNEALERAREIKSKILSSHLSTESCKAVSKYIDTIIPELAESEDEKTRKELLSFIESVQHNYLCATDRRKKWIAYLEKQKEQKPAECIPDSVKFGEGFKTGREVGFREGVESVKPVELSEGDEEMFESLHTCVCRCINNDRLDYAEREQISRRLIPFIERLKSLRPQSIQDKFDEAMHVADKFEEGYKAGVYDTKAKSWKPSEEQMVFLQEYIKELENRDANCGLCPMSKEFRVFNSLYNDLKKLM